MKKQLSLLVIVLTLITNTSCTALMAPQDDGVQATVVAQSIASTLTAQAPLSPPTSETESDEASSPTDKPADTLTPTPLPPTSQPTAIPTPQPTATPTATPLPTATPTVTPRPEPVQVKRYKDFVFELENCEASGSIVTCHFSVTNTGQDQEVKIEYYSEMYDNFNHQYESRSVVLGNKGGSSVRLLLVSGVATAGNLKFENVSDEVSSIALLRIEGEDDDYDDFRIEFRDIPLSRK